MDAMLDLLRVYTGCPTTGLQHLALPRETLLLYPSADSIIILNARNLAFVRALAFWEAFPGALHSRDPINRLSMDPNMKLIVASLGSRIATWAMSGIQSDTWRVHSSLTLPDGHHVTAIDCKSGLLAVGTLSTLSVYTLILENDLPTWSIKWTLPIGQLSRVRFSPSLMYMASTSYKDQVVRIYLTTSGKQTQSIPHPRPVTDMNWRMSQATSRDDSVLYTVTSDATLRVFLPVLDAPQHVQLHASLDVYTALPFSVASQTKSSCVFWLDRGIVSRALAAVLQVPQNGEDDTRHRRVREIKEEGWDLFLRVLSDGSLVVQAVVNIDRRPPTLLKQFTLLQSPPSSLPSLPDHLYILPNPALPGTLLLITSPPIRVYVLSPLLFFDTQVDGLRLVARGEDLTRLEDAKLGVEKRQIIRFERTPDGEGIGTIRMDGAGETWRVNSTASKLISKGRWKIGEDGRSVDQLVVLERGDIFVTYSSSTQLLTLHTSPPSTLSISSIVSIFALPNESGNGTSTSKQTLVAITDSQSIAVIDILLPSPSSTISFPSLSLRSLTSLPFESSTKLVLPVDPMAWSGSYTTGNRGNGHDVLLSVSEEGGLAFWIPTEGPGLVEWRCTGRVRTGKTGISIARCSSAKKSVLVVPGPEGEELTIWDSQESEFASGLEFQTVYNSSDHIHDLDWSSTPDNQSILAVGFAHRVELMCQQRMTYFDESSAWGLCWSIDLTMMIPHTISDSTWLKRGSLLVGAGHLMCLFGQPESGSPGSSPSESLFEYVARYNGPLADYHPQMLLQCLLWGKVGIVKTIIVNLAHCLEQDNDVYKYQSIPIQDFLKKDEIVKTGQIRHKPQYSSLFSVPESNEESNDEQFSTELVERLVERLEEEQLPNLTLNEQQSLVVLIQATLAIEVQRRALDSNGLRYLTTMRVFYIYNRRPSIPSTPASGRTINTQIQRRERLRYKDMVWAFHSECQDLLLSASVAACDNGKMCWPDARALGVFLWLRSMETLKAHMEVIARNQFLAGENRDPTKCSIFYFALGKVKLVHGLWRQASWHKEQGLMLKFLNNDFSEPRWRTAALKNAFALLSKRRFEYSAAFFLLGGSLKDAVSVCLKHLQDFQLAVAIARVVEQDDEGPVLRDILTSTVIPTAFKEGNRWLASWAFWLLRRRDLAVRILVTPLQDMAKVWGVPTIEIGEPHYDDPSLALLFSELKSKTLQTAKGTSEISGRTEFNFVLQMARVFCRMGCHALALDIVQSWSFHRPSVVSRDTSSTTWRPPSPITTRFALEPALRRRASIMIDMEIASEPPTRPASPSLSATNGAPVESKLVEKVNGEGDLLARKVGIGGLLKSAKQDLNVPEFDMNAFF